MEIQSKWGFWRSNERRCRKDARGLDEGRMRRKLWTLPWSSGGRAACVIKTETGGGWRAVWAVHSAQREVETEPESWSQSEGLCAPREKEGWGGFRSTFFFRGRFLPGFYLHQLSLKNRILLSCPFLFPSLHQLLVPGSELQDCW